MANGEQNNNDLFEGVDLSDGLSAKEVKSIFSSKTFWTNVLAIVAFAIQKHWGYVIDPALQAQIVLGLNIWLRKVTTDPVNWTAPKK